MGDNGLAALLDISEPLLRGVSWMGSRLVGSSQQGERD